MPAVGALYDSMTMQPPPSGEPATSAWPPPVAAHREARFDAPGAPPYPRHGSILTLLRFMGAHGMLSPRYARMLIALAWHKARLGKRLELDGIAFIRPGVRLEVGPAARLRLGRWSWLGDGTKLRVHEGEVSIGAKSVLGQECTISCYQRISIGRECMVADRSMLIDFDHVIDDVEQPIRKQGIRKCAVDIGHNVWLGYGVCVLRGVSVGDNCVIGASAVLTANAPANAVLAGIPARVIRMREPPITLRFE
jgi:acetyltransferase-like isoleucine patch superfamily enzyme